jgi:hypothetical protein
LAERVPDVLQETFESWYGLLVSILFLDRFHCPKLEHGLAARLDGRKAGPNVFGRLERQMFFDLVSQPVVVAPLKNRSSQAN